MEPNYPVLRFMAFSSATYSTAGGFANYVGSADDLVLAQELALAGDWEEAEVVDRDTGRRWFRLDRQWKEVTHSGDKTPLTREVEPDWTPASSSLYVWRWKTKLPERYGQSCLVIARGTMNTVQVLFDDGFYVFTSRWAVRLKRSTHLA